MTEKATVALCPFCQTGRLVLVISAEVFNLGEYQGVQYHGALKNLPVIECQKCGKVWRPDP